MANSNIFVADDDDVSRNFVCNVLSNEGYNVVPFNPGFSDNALLEDSYDLAILDMVMPGTSGFELREKILEFSPQAQIIMITGFPNQEKLKNAVDLGIYTFLAKPFRVDHIRYAAMGALRMQEVHKASNHVKAVRQKQPLPCGRKICVQTPKIRSGVKQFGPMDIPILLRGESGTGKEVTAECVYKHSPFSEEIFVPVNCAAISPNLIESELFGHAKGAFTGASKTKYGFFEVANGATLFLDEIGELPYEMQSKFLRVLDKGEFIRVGETEPRKTRVRVISATNVNLEEMVRAGKFRKDLYYRLKGCEIALPALRDRKNDIPALLDYFLGEEKIVIFPEALAILKDFNWPGNIRELKMVAEKLKSYAVNNMVTAEIAHKSLEHMSANEAVPNTEMKFKDYKKQNEVAYFTSLVKETKGNISKAAAKAGMDRKNLRDKLKKLEIEY